MVTALRIGASMRTLVLIFVAGLCLVSVARASERVWTVGPEVRNPLDAIYRHASGDLDGDSHEDVSAYCSGTDFVITDNTWPGIKGEAPATLTVGERSYNVEAQHLTDAGPYTSMLNQFAGDAVWMSWPAESAPDFSIGRIRVSIHGEERDYGEGANGALNAVREQCVRNVRGPPYN